MKAYKVFDPNWMCHDFLYKVGETYVYEGDIIPCKSGFHACRELPNCFNYYDFCSKNKVAEVELKGKIVKYEDKIVCSEITIMKELTWHEVLDLCNSGNGNSGRSNSGNDNSGNDNSGNGNSGRSNSGNDNSGNYNSGNDNSGNDNSGNDNSGCRNSGCRNSGCSNSGNDNSGNDNSGNYNSGRFNSGRFNSGRSNSGNYNSGNYNSGNYNSGFFNTDEPTVRMFNRDTNLNRCEINIPDFLFIDLVKWIGNKDMTENEKNDHPEHTTTGGFLKTLKYKEAWNEKLKNINKEQKQQIRDLPNFDSDIFYEITGVRIKPKRR